MKKNGSTIAECVTQIELFADISCPFTHVGLHGSSRNGSARVPRSGIRARAWPLEWINGRQLAPELVAAEIAGLRARVAPGLFRGFDAERLADHDDSRVGTRGGRIRTGSWCRGAFEPAAPGGALRRRTRYQRRYGASCDRSPVRRRADGGAGGRSRSTGRLGEGSHPRRSGAHPISSSVPATGSARRCVSATRVPTSTSRSTPRRWTLLRLGVGLTVASGPEPSGAGSFASPGGGFPEPCWRHEDHCGSRWFGFVGPGGRVVRGARQGVGRGGHRRLRGRPADLCGERIRVGPDSGSAAGGHRG